MTTLMGEVQSRTGLLIKGYRGGRNLDLAHLDRVYGLTGVLRAEEGGDPMVLGAAAYVHDYGLVLEHCTVEPSEPDAHWKDAKDAIAETLAVVDFPAELASQVCACVEFAAQDSFSGDALDTASLEGRILHDANRLDALGAIGVARTFTHGGAIGEPIWVEDARIASAVRARTTASVVDHIHERLLGLRDEMLTEAGRVLAEPLHDFMVIFLDQLRGERALALRGNDIP